MTGRQATANRSSTREGTAGGRGGMGGMMGGGMGGMMRGPGIGGMMGGGHTPAYDTMTINGKVEEPGARALGDGHGVVPLARRDRDRVHRDRIGERVAVGMRHEQPVPAEPHDVRVLGAGVDEAQPHALSLLQVQRLRRGIAACSPAMPTPASGCWCSTRTTKQRSQNR